MLEQAHWFTIRKGGSRFYRLKFFYCWNIGKMRKNITRGFFNAVPTLSLIYTFIFLVMKDNYMNQRSDLTNSHLQKKIFEMNEAMHYTERKLKVLKYLQSSISSSNNFNRKGKSLDRILLSSLNANMSGTVLCYKKFFLCWNLRWRWSSCGPGKTTDIVII